MHIAFITSEMYPFAKTGGLADYSYSLPKALADLGHTVDIFLPRYYCIDKQHYNFTLTSTPLAVPLGNEIRWAGIYVTNYIEGLTVYCIEHDLFFGRDGLYDYHGIPFHDNAQRFIFFSRACLEAIKQLSLKPDIIHCNDWQTASVPILLKNHYLHDPIFQHAKSVLTIHNVGYQGVFDKAALYYLQLDDKFFTPQLLEFFGQINLLKGGIIYSDCITTVSKRYAQEIQQKEFGYDLSYVIKEYNYKLHGILNGVDYQFWNPETDPFIPYKYSIHDKSGKQKCKQALLDFFGLKKYDLPVIGCITRLTYQKGIDLLIEALDWLFFDEPNVQFVILGSGEQWLIDRFESLRKTFPDRVGVWWGYNEQLAHLIEAGSDFYIMPSRYEPCGLNQMYSLAYGTIPIVHATGGLDDSIQQIDINKKTGNGFKYYNNTVSEIYSAIRHAIRIYSNKIAMDHIIRNAMSFKRSWHDAAVEYEQLFIKLLQ